MKLLGIIFTVLFYCVLFPNIKLDLNLFNASTHFLNSEVITSDRLSDSTQLVILFKKTNGNKWKEKWDLAQPMNEWYGVQLNKAGRVICIDLDGDANCSHFNKKGNGLVGSLPDLQLPELTSLSLSKNNLQGAIPDFSGIPKLKMLQLSCNALEGEIPDFSNLPALKSLELDYNYLSGVLPDFSNLPKLENLYLLANRFRGSIPDFSQLPSLRHLIANKNFIKGKLPAFSKSLSLKMVILSENQLEGELPDYSHLKKLKILKLDNNNLEGKIPSFNEVNELKVLNLKANFFDDCAQLDGSLPIENLDLSQNYLSFDDLNANKQFLSAITTYQNQQLLETDQVIYFEKGEDVFFDLGFDSNVDNSVYNWYHDGELLKTNTGDNTLLLEEVGAEVKGVYFCKITNPDFDSLTITSMNWNLITKEENSEIPIPNTTSDDLTAYKNRAEYFVPDGFSPNGDGVNDQFQILEFESNPDLLQNSEFTVFDRWGNNVFHEKPFQNNWDGTSSISNQPLAESVYYFTLQVKDKRWNTTGSIMIKR